MARSSELSEQEIVNIISSLKEEEADDSAEDADVQMKVVGASTVKHPSTVKVVDQESLPIDAATAKRMRKEAAKKKDSLLRVLKNNPTSPEAFDVVVEELAEEIFSLKFERERLELEDKDISNVAGKRVTAIKALIDTYLKKREISGNADLDLKSDQMQTVMRLIFTKMQDTFKASGYAPEAIQTFFQTFQKNMENFEIEAQRAIEQNR